MLNYNGLRYHLLQSEAVERPKRLQRGSYITLGLYKALFSVSQNQQEADRNLWISNSNICQCWKKNFLKENFLNDLCSFIALLCWLDHIALCKDCEYFYLIWENMVVLFEEYLVSISFFSPLKKPVKSLSSCNSITL